jgi:eukaryotic-like serine/threonine-protein kinase
MGRVEVALERGAAGFERIVALKRLLPTGPRDARHVQMFLREARLATLLRHPNVVHAFGFGEIDGELFLAMQYVEGEPLSRVLGAGKTAGRGLDPVLVAWVLAEACDGLHAAHELRDESGRLLRVVHRDVSPHNVMISYDGNVKVVDFGVARFDTGGRATRTGEVKGKMAYMSPEQALGEELDRRSDLFSVGAMLFECLTGRRLWGEGTDLELMRKIALERPPRLDVALPGAPPALVELQAGLVARDPGARPPTASDVATQLRAFATAAGGPTSRRVVPATMTALFSQDARRRRERLADALREASPSCVVALRPDLDLPLDEDPASEPPPPRPRWIAPAVVAGLAFGLGAAAWLTRSHPSIAPSPATSNPAPMAETSSPAPSPATSSPAPVAETRGATAVATTTRAIATPGSVPTLDASAQGTPAQASTLVGAPPFKPSKPWTHVASAPPAARPASPSKLPDVDPSPF